MSVEPNPLKTAAAEDVGADISNRFRYQAAFAAWLAVSALDGLPDVVAVYCEHHEDVLLELKGGVCDAIQVKSQGDGAQPLKGNADPVLRSLRRFAQLEHGYGSRFRRYQLANVSGFHSAGTSASNLGFCLEQARECQSPASPERPLATLISKIKAPKPISAETVLRALQKVTLDATLPKIRDMETRVREAIERLDGMDRYRASDLLHAAHQLIAMADAAGRSTQESSAENYVAYMDDPDAHAAKAAIEAKRLDLTIVRTTIRDAVEQAALLRSKEGGDVTKMPSTSSTAHKKLDAGGMPVHVVRILEDLRSSVEEEVERRLYRNGEATANAEYDHIQVLVKTLAEDARQWARNGGDEDYAQQMWSKLRELLNHQRQTEGDSLKGFTPEQLTGVAMILTELCQVWWSEPFELEEKK